MTALLQMSGVHRHFIARTGLLARLSRRPHSVVHAVDGVDLQIARGERFGLIGESGCGKSTLGRLALRLREPTAGVVRFDGVDLGGLSPAALAALRSRMQIVFQDPYSSLNPRRTVGEIIGLPLRLHRPAGANAIRTEVVAMLEAVGLGAEHLHRYPHQFSGGQRQRIGIARALVLRPEFLVCDEPVSALDVSIQAQIIELLERLRRELGLAWLFISHDIAVVARLADRVGVMYLGRIVETGPTRQIIAAPAHPYTQALLAAVPRVDAGPKVHVALRGEPPSPFAPPTGCAFHARCPFVMEVCRRELPGPGQATGRPLGGLPSDVMPKRIADRFDIAELR